jgi:two-component system sensor histidine kinase PilS (NtrC family)
MRSNNKQQLLEQQQHDRELIVRVYALFRLLIASTMLALTVLAKINAAMNIEPLPWFALSSALYMATAILTAVIVFRHLSTQESSTLLMLWTDILLLPLITINAGNFSTSIGMLLALSFLLGSLSLQQGYAVRALAAAIFLITALWISQSFSTGSNLNLSNSLSLGLAYLMIGFLSLRLARYLNITEEIVLQQHLSLKNQIDVNAFIIQQLRSGALVVDPGHRIKYGNDAAWQMLGCSPESSNQQLASLSEDLDTALQKWQETTTASQQTSSVHLKQDVSVRFTDFGSSADGGVLITLEDQKDAARQAQQLKLASLGKLTAGVAHEIRNPLSAIHQAAQLLEESSSHDPQQMRLLEIIQTNTRRMNSQVEEILQLSRRTPNSESIQLKQWLQPLIDEYRNSSLAENNQLLLQLPDIPCPINFDAEQLRQVLLNLITNAQQHSSTAEGELIVSVSVDCAGMDKTTTIDVEDNGEAIPQEQAGKLFDPFYTTHNTGTGLGLYLSRELCLNNNADLEFIPMKNSNIFRISLKE